LGGDTEATTIVYPRQPAIPLSVGRVPSGIAVQRRGPGDPHLGGVPAEVNGT